MRARILGLALVLTLLIGGAFFALLRWRHLAAPGESIGNQNFEWALAWLPAVPCMALALAAFALTRERKHLLPMLFSAVFAFGALLSLRVPLGSGTVLSPGAVDLLMAVYFAAVVGAAPLGAWLGWWLGKRWFRAGSAAPPAQA